MRCILNEDRLSPGSNGTMQTDSGFHSYHLPPSIALPVPQHEHEEVETLRREKLELHAQLSEAAQIQRKLSGPRQSHIGSLQFASEVFAASLLSGDFITILQNGGANESKVLAVHGDIAGKGVAAGMWFTNLAGHLQSYSHQDADTAKIAAAVNRQLCDLRPVAPFVTAFLAQLDCDLGKVTYCNAGHFPPILFRRNGQTVMLDKGGPLLGAIESAEFHTGELTLNPGDMLVAYSDGVLECRNVAGEEFGVDRIVDALRHAEQQSAQATLMMLLATLQDFANGSPLCDDVSLTVIRRDLQSGTPLHLLDGLVMASTDRVS
jgi:serine phosphatase RsbU (regulator of sigma subunit)